MADVSFALGPALDRSALAARFSVTGRVRVTNFLAHAAAVAMRDHLLARSDWIKVINAGNRVYELDRATLAAFPPERARSLDEAVYVNARAGFQYRYESIRVPDGTSGRVAMKDPLGAFAMWMSGGEARGFLRDVTGDGRIAFADAQATSYGSGDFLTAHDDNVEGKRRHAAYVLGLTPSWRLEWGGLLIYHDAGDAGFAGTVPAFNTLDLFRVPQVHSVSLVSPAATHPRHSVTGWLRSGVEPA